jgi:thiamine-monophosphate kinase
MTQARSGSRATRGSSSARSTEFARIARLSQVLGAGAARSFVEVDVGDDAAVLGRLRGRLVWTIDAAVDMVHFRRDLLGWQDVGWRSLHAAASDLAAMGASPVAALSALALPRALLDRELLSLVKGQREAADALGCPVIGGNLSRARVLSITTTVLGQAPRPVLRSGARIGDEVWLVGDVGLAAAGLSWLMKKRRGGGRAVEHCVSAWRRPVALIDGGLGLVGRAHAAIDVSDGLAADAGHIAESSGVRLVIEESCLGAVLHEDLSRAARLLGVDPLVFALTGGEDYALLAVGPRRRRPCAAVRIGRVERGLGVVVEKADGKPRNVSSGFDHFP